MELTMLAKDTASGGEGCPSVYLATSGELVIQGVTVDGDTFGNLANVLQGESAVRISPDVVIAAVARLKG
jgi:hypothetical protein